MSNWPYKDGATQVSQPIHKHTPCAATIERQKRAEAVELPELDAEYEDLSDTGVEIFIEGGD